MIFPDARVDCVHHIEPAYCSQGVAEIVLHEINQFIGVSLCGDSIVPRLLCARSGCFSSSLLLYGFPALSLGFCFLRESFSSLTVCLGSGIARKFCLPKSIDRGCNGERKQSGNKGKSPTCCPLLCLRLGFLPLGLGQSFAVNPAVATGPDHRSEHVVRDLYAPDTVAVSVPAWSQLGDSGKMPSTGTSP